MTKIDFSTWRTTKSNPHIIGKTIKIDGGSYSIEIQSIDAGRGQWLFQRGQYDNQHGRFDKQIRSGIGDTFEHGHNQLISAVKAYASHLHDVDLDDWQRNLDSATETYWKSIELGDRDYAVEIRQLSEKNPNGASPKVITTAQAIISTPKSSRESLGRLKTLSFPRSTHARTLHLLLRIYFDAIWSGFRFVSMDTNERDIF